MTIVRTYVTDPDGTRHAMIPSGAFGTFTRDLFQPSSLELTALASDLSELELVDREIQVWIGDETSPRFVGVPVGASKSAGSGRVSVSVVGLEFYLARWRIDESLSYNRVDQLNIGSMLLAWAQGRTVDGADRANIDSAAFTLSGVQRDRDYDADELTTVLDALQAFREIDNGFDWSIEPVGADRREWTPYYPRRGTLWTASALFHRPGRESNVATLGYSIDASNVTRRHHATSSSGGDGPDKLVGTYVDPTLASPDTRVLLESASAESTSIIDVATLVEHAQARVEAAKAPARSWKALVTDPTIALGIGPGDTIEVDLSDGWQTFAGLARVVAVELDPVAERAVLDLAEEP